MLLYAHSFDSMKYKINDFDLNVRDQGQGEQILFFLHYWGGSSRTWGEVIKRLENDFRCIAYDHRGWGNSDAPPSGYRIEDLAHDAEVLIRKLGLRRYVLVGHSMGGKVAQLLASWRPTGLEGLLLIAPSPPVPMAVPEEQRKKMIEAYSTRQGVEGLIQHVLTAVPIPRKLRDIIIADTLGGAPQAKRAWPETGMIEDISPAVRNINVPTLVLCGENDQVERVETLKQELIPRIPEAQMKVIPRSGHLSPLEVPDEIAAGIRNFLVSLRSN
jgi:pimeloyl-ACP methyl ester carboxylesterase